jgi:hypothetical protein
VKSEQLLTQGKIFKDDILAGPECTNHPAEEVPEPYDHAQNLTGTLPIELAAKSLILRVYDVLMNDSWRRTGICAIRERPVFPVLSTQNSPACPEYQGESDEQHHSEQTNPNHIPTHIPTLHAISVHGASS